CLHGKIWRDLVDRQSSSARDLFFVMDWSGFRIALPHLAKGFLRILFTKVHRNFSSLQVEPDLPPSAKAMQVVSSSQSWMSREWKLLLDGEDPHSRSVAALFLHFSRQNERRFGKIRFARERLHLLGRESTRIGKDRELISFEWMIGKDVEEDIWKTAARSFNHQNSW